MYLISFACCNILSHSPEKQELLAINDLKDRAYRLLFILNREYQLIELKASIQMKTHEDINKQQKEYFLQQQIKAIQEELGGNMNDIEIKELREKAKSKNGRRKSARSSRKKSPSSNVFIRNRPIIRYSRNMCRPSSVCRGGIQQG